jgi:hypothetical protein
MKLVIVFANFRDLDRGSESFTCVLPCPDYHHPNPNPLLLKHANFLFIDATRGDAMAPSTPATALGQESEAQVSLHLYNPSLADS